MPAAAPRVFQVEDFGAVDDCPDVSLLDRATQQAQIVAAVTSATDSTAAFRLALIAARDAGGGVVEIGGNETGTGTGIYRIAYSATIPGLAIPANTTLRFIGRGRIELDPSKCVNWGTLSAVNGRSPPAGKGWIEGRIDCGDPETCYRNAPTAPSVEPGGFYFPAGSMTSASFLPGVRIEGADIRMHTRVAWRDKPANERWRLSGIVLHMCCGATVERCYTEGTPNDGITFVGGFANRMIAPRTKFIGFGGQKGTSKNGISLYPVHIVGVPDLSSHSIYVSAPITQYSRDEGIAYGPTRGIFITDHQSIGDQDRAIEGVYSSTLTSATLGATVYNETFIRSLNMDGRFVTGRGTIAAGSTALQLNDAFYTTPNDESGYRWVFIEGADSASAQASITGAVLRAPADSFKPGMRLSGMGIAAGTEIIELIGRFGGVDRWRVSVLQTVAETTITGTGDGPYRIGATNVVTNVVTLLDAPTASVSDATVYTHAIGICTANNGCENRIVLDTIRAKNVYSTIYSPMATGTASGLSITIRDVEVTHCYLSASMALILATADTIFVDRVRAAQCYTGLVTQNVSLIQTSGAVRSVTVTNVECDAGFGYLTRLGTTVDADLIAVRDCVGYGTYAAPITIDVMDRAVRIRLVQIDSVKLYRNNLSGSGWPAILIRAGTVAPQANFDRIEITRTLAADSVRAATNPVVIDAASSWGTDRIGKLVVEDCTFGSGDFFYGNEDTPPYAASTRTNVTEYVDRNNGAMGQRIRRATAAPTTGTWAKGDVIISDNPVPGQPERWVCTTSGSFITLGTVTASTTAGSRFATFSDASLIVTGMRLSIGGSVTRKVVRVDGPSVEFSQSAPATVTNAAVTSRTCVFTAVPLPV